MLPQSYEHERAMLLRRLLEADMRLRLKRLKLTPEYDDIIADLKKQITKLDVFSKR